MHTVMEAVVALRRSDNEVGTGFLFREGLLLTAHHVLPDAQIASTTTAQFDSVAVELDPRAGFSTNADLDYTVVAVAASGLGVAPLAPNAVFKQGDDVFLIHHPDGGSKRISYAENDIAYVDATVIRYRADTDDGSSGAPVCDRRWRVIAMHHEGGRFPDPARGGSQLLNEGVRASAIANDLRGRQK